MLFWSHKPGLFPCTCLKKQGTLLSLTEKTKSDITVKRFEQKKFSLSVKTCHIEYFNLHP